MGQNFDKFLSPTTHIIRVRTGDKKYAGTDADISVRFHHEGGESSTLFKLDVSYHDDFVRGQVDEFKLCERDVSASSLSRIEIVRGHGGLGSDWFCDYIEVVDNRIKKTYIFPVHRWIQGERSLYIHLFDAVLPKDDAHQDQRNNELVVKRTQYEYMAQVPGLPVQVKNFPEVEAFSDDYKHRFEGNGKNSVLTVVLRTLFSSASMKTLKQYESAFKLFSPLGKPSSIVHWREEKHFGAMRVMSCNPCVIELCTKIPEKFGVTAEMVEPFLEGMTLSDAMAARKIYLTDQKALIGIKGNKKLHKDLQFCQPLGLFYATKDDEMIAIAIQLYQEKGDQNPVFLPNDDANLWTMVKLWYNMADSNHHQAETHLGNTHLKAEGASICTHRNLSPSHPVFKILAPHFLHIMAINKLALTTLLSENGVINSFFAAGLDGVTTLFKGTDRFRLNVDSHLPNDVKARGMDDPEVLRNYPYRDDAMLSWNALHKYVKSTVALYYESDKIVQEDHEIQQWGKELVAPVCDGGIGMRGVPGNGKFETVADLVETITCIIYLCSVKHAAVNFSQYDEYGFPATRPAHLMGEPPKNKDPLTEGQILAALPDKVKGLTLAAVAKVLSMRATQPLGYFETTYLYDQRALEIASDLREDLLKASQVIKERNKTRTYLYDICDPTFIPNSISI
ncbi:allene oxide synthase-lipoxygenase protein-like [Lineus longissimus]|uniref:allene oxide synthase-lipoxygenase protein-like n=1 Tax=Lineus longissimus TaxID=88925 RepID=UPI002B4C7D25